MVEFLVVRIQIDLREAHIFELTGIFIPRPPWTLYSSRWTWLSALASGVQLELLLFRIAAMVAPTPLLI
jgi:hypothetical protein